MTTETFAIFGATGATGSEVLAAVLEQGYKARIMIRNPAKLEELFHWKQHPNLTVIHGDCFADDFKAKAKETVEGADYVISTVGGPKMGKKNDFPVGKILKYVQELIDVIVKETSSSVKGFSHQSGAFCPHPDGTHPLISRIFAKVLGEWIMGDGLLLQENKSVQDYLYSIQDETKFHIVVTRPGQIVKGEKRAKLVPKSSPYSGAVTFRDLALFTLEAVKDASLQGVYPYPNPE